MLAAAQVKTQRALNDYRKSAYPHYKDEITRLRFIGVVSANRLKDARAHLGQDVPVACVETVQDLKKLVEYAEANRYGTPLSYAKHDGVSNTMRTWCSSCPLCQRLAQRLVTLLAACFQSHMQRCERCWRVPPSCSAPDIQEADLWYTLLHGLRLFPVCLLTCRKVESKLLEMLNMRGRHKHKWDSLRQVLSDKVVYDDTNIRIWMAPNGSGQGLMYYAKQAQVCKALLLLLLLCQSCTFEQGTAAAV